VTAALGFAQVEVRADLGPLQTDFARGEQQAQKFTARMKQTASAGGAALTDMGAKGAAGLDRIRLAGEKAAEAAALMTGPLGGVASRISILSRVTSAASLGFLGGAAAITGFGFAVKRAAEESEKFERLQLRTAGVLKATGYAAGLTGGQIRQMADDLDKTTLIDPADAEKAMQLLLTFKNVQGEVFKEAVSLGADLSVLFGDMSSGALQLGKALEDPTNGMGALRRSGISFSPVQQDQIKKFQETGDLLSAQKTLLAVVAGQVRGLAQSDAPSLTAATDDMNDAWDRFLRALGDMGPIKGALAGLANLAAGAIQAARSFAMPTSREQFDLLSENLKRAKAEMADLKENNAFVFAPRLEAEIAALEKHRSLLGEEIMQTQSMLDLDDERERSKARLGQAEQAAAAAAESAAARAKDRLPAQLAADTSAIQDHLMVVQAANAQEAASTEAKYARGEITAAAYYAKLKQITASGIAAEIDALKKERDLAAGGPAETDSDKIAVAQRVASINAQIAAKQFEATTAQIQLDGEAGQTRIKQAQDRLALEGQIAAAEGDRHAAEVAALNELLAKNDELMKKSGMGDDERQAHLDRMREVGEARIALGEAKEEADAVLSDIATKVALIQQSAATGAITDAKAQADTIALQKEKIPVLDAIIVRMEKSNALLQDPANKQAIDSLKVSTGQLAVETDRYAVAAKEASRALGQDLRNATSSLFQNLITDPKNWKDHMLGFFRDVANGYAKMAADMATKALFGDLGGAGGGGFDWAGLISGLLGSMAGGYFGGASGSADAFGSTPSGAGTQHTFIKHGGGIVGQGDARSTRVHPAAFINAPRYHKGISSVGNLGLRPDERAAILQTGEEVIPRGGRGRRDGGGVTNVWNVTTPDAASFHASRRQMQRDARREMGIKQ